jgi:hypothetical protein
LSPTNKRPSTLLSLLLLIFVVFGCTPPQTTAPPVINSFEASDRLLAPGGRSTLSWDVENATSLRITADTGQHLGDVTGQDSAENVPHTQTTTHTLTATNAAGSVTETVTVNVITVSSDLPADIPGGAQAATLQDAAAFAWQEFIALNWPAMQGNRDMPSGANFGSSGPVVWETFRHKVEIFPGTGTPHGGSTYNDPPQYVYDPTTVGSYTTLPAGQVPACGTASTTVPYINLDEQSEIGLDQMFSAAGPGGQFSGHQILFLAKANQVEYDYVFSNGWYGANPVPFGATVEYLKQNSASPPPGSATLVSFPNGTIEMKAAWRRLTQAEMDSGRFYTTPVRYYEYQDPAQTYDGVAGDATKPCYVDEATGWGLVGLHIIHKTPSAPYFIYATFEQGDNLVDQMGNPVEDENGNIVGSQTAAPLTPDIASRNAVSANPPTPASVQELTPATANSTPPANGLYFENTPDNTSEPQGLIYVNRRVHDIPQDVIDANEAAHEAIAAYNQANNIPSSPWEYYKLVNVQYQPINKPTPGEDYTGDDAATYYQANIVVETDYNLQVFSGIFQPGTTDVGNVGFNNAVVDPANPSNTKNIVGLITDFNNDGSPATNVYYNAQGYNMGGCMGCHGNAQAGGSDFSFILLGGRVPGPEVGAPESPPNLDKYSLLLQAQP